MPLTEYGFCYNSWYIQGPQEIVNKRVGEITEKLLYIPAIRSGNDNTSL